ncbi:MAG: NAD-dependent epimerase/dehydratase family protein [Variibacter sp.]
MKVIITGGGGYLGEKLAAAIVKRGKLVGRSGKQEQVEHIALVGRSIGKDHKAWENAEGIRIERVAGSVTDHEFLKKVISGESVTVFHLAAVLPGVTERDLTAALDINVDGTRNVLDALAQCGPACRFVATSSLTVFGRDEADEPVSERTVMRPATVYGHTKAIGEMLVGAYAHAGKVDGRCARLSTVVVRPHKIGSSAGASISDALRDITLGVACDVLLAPSTRAAIIDYDTSIEGLIHLQTIDRDLMDDDPTVNFPALTASVEEMIEEASAAARRHGRSPGIINFKPDTFAQTVIDGWATGVDGTRAEKLGISPAKSLREICDGVWRSVA